MIPSARPLNPGSSDHYSHLKIVLFCPILKIGDGWTDVRTYRRTICVIIVITNGLNCWWPEWINITQFSITCLFFYHSLLFFIGSF